jgi:hypothetical protein
MHEESWKPKTISGYIVAQSAKGMDIGILLTMPHRIDEFRRSACIAIALSLFAA